MKTILLTTLVLLFSSCSHTAADFKKAELEPDKGPVFAKFTVLLNQEDITENCTVCVNSTRPTCQSLNKEGAFILGLHPDVYRISSLSCFGSSITMGGAWFTAPGPGQAGYLGDVLVNWTDSNSFGLKGRGRLDQLSFSDMPSIGSDVDASTGIVAGVSALTNLISGQASYQAGAGETISLTISINDQTFKNENYREIQDLPQVRALIQLRH